MNKRDKGNSGEDVACVFLRNHGFEIVERNYQKIWGELDIIAKKGGDLHFVEVKSVSHSDVFDEYGHRPEDNVHGLKVRHLRRMIETYLAEKGSGLSAQFYFHVICVYMDMETRRAKVKWLKDIIL